MELIYRGTTYDYNPNKAPGRPFEQVREAGPAYNLTYRGVTYRVDPNVKQSEAPVRPAAYELIYRGVTYCVNRNEQGEVTAITSSTSPSKKRTLTIPARQKPFRVN
ncbi:DUF4278 domain-containing protein [Gloeocapsa sp. BRSZ]